MTVPISLVRFSSWSASALRPTFFAVVGAGVVAHDAEHVGLASVLVHGAAHRLAVDRERAVRPAVGRGPRPERLVDLLRVDPDEHVPDHRAARRDAGSVPEAHAEIRQDLGREVLHPLADRLVAAGAGQRRGQGEAEDRRQRVAPALAAARVVDVREERRHGHHLFLAEGHLGNSFLQVGFETGAAEPGPRVAAQGEKEHALRRGMLPVAFPGATEPPGEPRLDPVGGAVHGPVEAGRVDIGLQKQDLVAEAGRPVPDQSARA